MTWQIQLHFDCSEEVELKLSLRNRKSHFHWFVFLMDQTVWNLMIKYGSIRSPIYEIIGTIQHH